MRKLEGDASPNIALAETVVLDLASEPPANLSELIGQLKVTIESDPHFDIKHLLAEALTILLQGKGRSTEWDLVFGAVQGNQGLTFESLGLGYYNLVEIQLLLGLSP